MHTFKMLHACADISEKKFGSQCKNAGFVVERINLKMKKQTIGKVFTVAENNCRMKYKIQ